jgi:hypothetical protein
VSDFRIRPRSSVAPVIEARRHHRDEQIAQHFLDALFVALVLVVLFIVVCLPPIGAPR